MAEKRMFAKTIISSDAFLTMGHAAQCLYFQLSMNADDDGLLNNTIMIIRLSGCSQSDFDELLEKNFILSLGKNIYVIKHWHINNYIRTDRKRDSVYKEEVSNLKIKENGAYSYKDKDEDFDGVVSYTDQEELDKDVYEENEDRIISKGDSQSNDGQLPDTCLPDDGQDTGNGQADDGHKTGTGRDASRHLPESWQEYDSSLTDKDRPTASQVAGSCQAVDGQLPDTYLPDDGQLPAQYRIDKDRVDKDRLNITHTSKVIDKQINIDTDKENVRVEDFDSEYNPRKDYAQILFDIFFVNNLPCCNKNFIAFMMRDFRLGLAELSGLHIHSDDVIQAVKNYVSVISLKRDGKSWWESELSFYGLCKNKNILKFLPGEFALDNFKKIKKQDEKNGVLARRRKL